MRELTEDVLEDIRYRVVQGFDNREAVFEWILANYPQQLGITKEEYGVEDLDAETNGTLRDTIETAFDDKTKETESWPELTDCDRLRRAFDALDKQGIVALESPGLTQDDSIPYAADVASARDELGGVEARGYCFFTWNDMARAIDGDGLSLAYGTFKEEPERPAELAPPPCPLCKGRGWIAPSDSTAFPTTCSCRSAPVFPTKAQEAPPTLGQKVGAAVLAACRDAGLDVEWTGAPEAFIEMPRFRWQRRPTVTKESDVQDFLDGWELEMRAGYTSPNETLTTLDERASDWFETFSDFGPSLRARLRSHTEKFLEKEQSREATWSEATINDRITSAFEELNRRGVLAREDVGLTIQDGWGYMGAAAESSHRGAVFFHREDVIDAVGGRGLLLAFGALNVQPSEDDAASAALASEVLLVLQTNGIACSWNGSLTERIRVAPFEWRRRRWTPPPPHQLVDVAQEAPKRPSLLARMFGAGRTEQAKERPLVSAAHCGVVVRAVRSEGAINLRRRKEFQEAWKALGNPGDAQAGHPGIPHMFIRAGSFFSLAPLLATANLRSEKNEIFLRGARSKAAKSETT
ncbi:MAG: hypothetical protein U0169_08455 [Polyangiaceae bacterium]